MSNTRTNPGDGAVPCDSAERDTRPIDAPQPREHPLTGVMLQRAAVYLESQHARGAAGVIYRAFRSGRRIAVKVARRHSDIANDSIRREARVLRSIDCPCVVHFEDDGVLSDGRPWLGLEYLAGRSLEGILTAHGPLGPHRVVRWLRQACRGLAAIHARGWVHRDVKPSNLMVVGREDVERVKVIDLGIAEPIGACAEVTSGTPDYIAPEQARNGPADVRSDVYSLGCCAYELMTGRHVVPGGNDIAKLMAHIEGVTLVWPDEPALPDPLRRLIERCLAHAPDARPPNMHALDRWLALAQGQLA